MRYSVLSQATLLVIGLIVPIGVPAVMGLDYYGRFVALTASAFLIQRLADFPAETLIFEGDRRRLLLRSAALQSTFMAMAAVVSSWTSVRIELLFLMGLQCSSVAFSLVLSCRSDRLTLAYLATFLAAYLAALLYALGSGSSLAWAIAVPNFLALLWIPWALRAPMLVDAAAAPGQGRRLHIPVLDVALRVAAGSFVAFATLGLAVIATTDRAVDTAQIRLLGTALGFSAFLLPWPMKSLVGILQAAQLPALLRLLRYLRGTQWLALVLIGLAIGVPATSRLALCAGLSLVFLNYLVVERWNIAQGSMAGLARIALLATVAALAAFKLISTSADPVARASVSILTGCALYAVLSWKALPTQSAGRTLAAELSWVSIACAAALVWSQR